MSTNTRTYGGWRERRGFGLAGLSGTQTSIALVVVLVLLGVALIRPGMVAVMGLPLATAVAVITLRIRGESAASWTGRHTAWALARWRHRTGYQGLDSARLPGVLGSISLMEAHDESGTTAGFTWDRRAQTLTAVVPVEPLGLSLVGAEQVAEWVDAWGDWLTHLGYLPDVKHVVVTVHTGPGPPTVRSEPDAGDVATVVHEVARQLNEQSGGTGSTQVSRTLVSVTIGVPSSDQVESAATRLLELLSTMQTTLGRCGVSVLPAMTAQELVQWVRGVFEPSAMRVLTSANWVDARPTATEEHWGHYQHDAGYSAAYVWDEVPGQSVTPDVLSRLLGPSDYHKRVSLVYEPIAAHSAVREVDRQAEAAAFRSQYRRRLGRDETARDRADLERARQTATDQVTGSGLVDVGLYAVVTTGRFEDLARCVADLENRAGESRIRLRRNYGAQSSTFACTVGVGFVPRRGVAR